MTRTLALVPLALLAAARQPVRCQDRPVGDTLVASHATVSIVTDTEGARVMLNGQDVGSTPLTVDSLFPGVFSLMIVPSDASDWLTEIVHDTIEIAAGEMRTLRYRLRKGILLNSVPSGATVRLGDSLAGTTPLLIPSRALEHSHVVTVSLEGYHPATLQAGPLLDGSLTVPLARHWTRDGTSGLPMVLPESADGRTLPAVLSGAGAILAGAAAAYLKIEADERNATYRRSLDPRILAERDRLDRAAAFSLVIMQVGMGVLMYILLTD
jgi:hypothetical protein